MQLQEALRLIQEFWQEPTWPFQPAPTAQAELDRLRKEFPEPLPAALEEYIVQAAPEREFFVTAVGNPFEIYGLSQLSILQDGYNFNSLAWELMPGWPEHWFIIAQKGLATAIIDLKAANEAVIQPEHIPGGWKDGTEIAASIGQFLLCAAAVQHALLHLGGDDAIRNHKNGVRLVPEAAAWLFPRMREWAGPYYDAWCSVFDNA